LISRRARLRHLEAARLPAGALEAAEALAAVCIDLAGFTVAAARTDPVAALEAPTTEHPLVAGSIFRRAGADAEQLVTPLVLAIKAVATLFVERAVRCADDAALAAAVLATRGVAAALEVPRAATGRVVAATLLVTEIVVAAVESRAAVERSRTLVAFAATGRSAGARHQELGIRTTEPCAALIAEQALVARRDAAEVRAAAVCAVARAAIGTVATLVADGAAALDARTTDTAPPGAARRVARAGVTELGALADADAAPGTTLAVAATRLGGPATRCAPATPGSRPPWPEVAVRAAARRKAEHRQHEPEQDEAPLDRPHDRTA
jgi:hypothetical protein